MAADDIVSKFVLHPVSCFRIADPSDELRKRSRKKGNLGTTVVGILRPEAMVICADGRITDEYDHILKENCIKLYTITDSVVGSCTGEATSCNKVLAELMKTLEQVPPSSMEEIAGCLAHWANAFHADNEFVIGGRLSNVDRIQMFQITERSPSHAAIDQALKHSTIAVKEYRGISTGPYVAHAHSVVAIGGGGPIASSVLECADPVDNDESLRILAKKALEHAANPNGCTGGVLRFITMTRQHAELRFHSSYPLNHSGHTRRYRYCQPIEGEFKLLKGNIQGYTGNYRGHI